MRKLFLELDDPARIRASMGAVVAAGPLMILSKGMYLWMGHLWRGKSLMAMAEQSGGEMLPLVVLWTAFWCGAATCRSGRTFGVLTLLYVVGHLAMLGGFALLLALLHLSLGPFVSELQLSVFMIPLTVLVGFGFYRLKALRKGLS